MKEGISIAGIFPFVILFILLFTGIMTYTINNANAFGIKDEIINIINLSSGDFIEDGSLNDDIIDSMEANSYRNTGKCEDNFYGFDRNGQLVSEGGNASVCIKCIKYADKLEEEFFTTDRGFEPSGATLRGYYFHVQVFYQLDIPVIKSSFNLKTNGESKVIYSKNYPSEMECVIN